MKVEITGLQNLLKEMEKISIGKKREIFSETVFSSIMIQKKAKENLTSLSAIDRGHLRQSIIAEAKQTKSKVIAEIGPTAKYGPFVEFGTRPHFPPLKALKKWAKRHGFSSAWPICVIISKRGLRARAYLVPAYEEVKGGYFTRIKEILER